MNIALQVYKTNENYYLLLSWTHTVYKFDCCALYQLKEQSYINWDSIIPFIILYYNLFKLSILFSNIILLTFELFY